ncbi:hypothetical protein BH18VER2_BH18VER2_06600 [soil metagenome]
MLEILVRKFRSLCLGIALPAACTLLYSSCATDKPRTALIDDPDARNESAIPWNKPAKWESGANVPGGIGGGAASIDN